MVASEFLSFSLWSGGQNLLALQWPGHGDPVSQTTGGRGAPHVQQWLSWWWEACSAQQREFPTLLSLLPFTSQGEEAAFQCF